MDAVRTKVRLGILGGALIAMGSGVALVWAMFVVWSHHMFIVGLTSPAGVVVLLLPMLAIVVGLGLVIRALRRGAGGIGVGLSDG